MATLCRLDVFLLFTFLNIISNSRCKNLSLITIPKVYSNIVDVLSEYSGDLIIKSVGNNYSYEDGLLIDKSNKELVLYQSKNNKLEIPNCIKEIGKAAFSGCTSLQQIVIPNSVTEIGKNAFWRCTALQEIVLPKSHAVDITDLDVISTCKVIRK